MRIAEANAELAGMVEQHYSEKALTTVSGVHVASATTVTPLGTLETCPPLQ